MDEMERTILLDGTSSVSSEPQDDGRDGTMPTLALLKLEVDCCRGFSGSDVEFGSRDGILARLTTKLSDLRNPRFAFQFP